MAGFGKTGKLWKQLWETASKSTPKRAYTPLMTRGYAEGVKSATQSFRDFATFTGPRPVIAQYATRRSCTTGSALLMSLHQTTKSTNGAVVETTLVSAKPARKQNTSLLAGELWRRGIHGCPDCRRLAQKEAANLAPLTTIRSESTKHEGKKPHYVDKAPSSHTKPVDPPATPPPQDSAEPHSYFHLPDMHNLHLPKLPHRPTKQELLAAASGFWSRLRVRFKWLTIRSVRPWNVDDWSAFVSWFVVGHIVWILLGTTTFISALIYAINTIAAQGTFEGFSCMTKDCAHL